MSANINLSNFQLLPTLTLSASGVSSASGLVDLDLNDLRGLCIAFQITGTANATLTIYDGYGGGDANSVITYGIPLVIGGSSVPVYTSSGTSYNLINAVSDLYVDVTQLPRWIRLKLVNNAATSVTIQLYGAFN